MPNRNNALIAVVAAAGLLLGGCDTSFPENKGDTATITPPPGAHHSMVADIYVPPAAALSTDTASSEGETYYIHLGYAQTVAQQEALLPVGKWLGKGTHPREWPWCKKSPMPSSALDNTSWFWGWAGDAVIVSVNQDLKTDTIIVIRHTTEASLYCGPLSTSTGG